jgi:hypothetical protein
MKKINNRNRNFKEEETLEQASLRLYPVNIVKLNDTLEMDSNATKRMAFIEGAEYNTKQNENGI